MNHMECIAILQLDFLLPLIGEGNIHTHKTETGDITARLGSMRLRTFAEKGTDCVVCGCRGAFFSLERHTRRNKATGTRKGFGHWHINLYGRNKAGNIVLMTRDHIWPRSLGGYDIMENSITMCSHCNEKKGSKPPTRAFTQRHGGAYDPMYLTNQTPAGKIPAIQPKKKRTPEEIAAKEARRAAWQANPVFNGRTKQDQGQTA